MPSTTPPAHRAYLCDAIVAANTNGDCYGTDFSGTFNLIGIGGSGGLVNGVGNNIVGVATADLLLGSLGNYGGPTDTIPLLPNSPAYHKGDPLAGMTVDQRGEARSDHPTDIGAFEGILYVVDTTEDNPINDGTLSLRDAINAANAIADNATITFDPTVFTPNATHTIDLTDGELGVDSNDLITIDGPGANVLTINAQGQSRIFYLSYGGFDVEGVTITGGNASVGGGIFNSNGDLTVTDSTITGNSATTIGGGIYSGKDLDVVDSSISANSASYGGGIATAPHYFDFDRSGRVTIQGSTLTGNIASESGGALYLAQVSSIQNSTIYDNVASSGGGGGVYVYGGVNFDSTDCTISGNSASTGAGIDGGGTLYGTLIAGNPGGDLSGSFAGFDNLVGDGSGGLASDANILPTGSMPIDPLLAPIGNYGGPTDTMPLLPGSPAIDQGVAAANLVTDQRGEDRSSASPDIGAFAGILYQVNTLADQTDSSGSSTVSLRDAINRANASGDDATITFDPTLFASGSSATMTLSEPLELNNDSGTETIVGPGAGTLEISGGNTNRIFTIDAGSTVAISGLTLGGGLATVVDGLATVGGAIDNGGSLTVTDSVVSGNTASGNGGGIYNSSTGALDVIGTTINNNISGQDGGGISSQGAAGIYDSTIAGNSAETYGGGVFADGALRVTNSTLYGNSAQEKGGGIYTGDPSQFTITDSTLSANTSTTGGGIFGGGTISGTIVANDSGHDLAGAFQGTYDLIGDGSGGLSAGSGNILGTTGTPINPLLEPLANNGGPTETMALSPESPAISAGAVFNGPDGDPITADERSISRPQVMTPDIGAYETFDGTGLDGQYFTTTSLIGLSFTRTDPTVDFNWSSASPDSAIPQTYYSVRWTGQVQALFTQTYTFYINADDGARLWVDGKELVNDWTDADLTTDTGTISLVAGQKYDIEMDYYQLAGNALAQLAWSSPGQVEEIIPEAALYPVDLPPPPPVPVSAQGVGSNEVDLQWTDYSAGQAQYIVERSQGAGNTDYQQIARPSRGNHDLLRHRSDSGRHL